MDFAASEGQFHWRDVARDFAERVIKPDMLRRDRPATAEERIPWDWIRETEGLWGHGSGHPHHVHCRRRTGRRRPRLRRDHGPALEDRTFVLRGDDGRPASAFHTARRRRSRSDDAIGIAEEGARSDHQGYYDEPEIDLKTTAVRDGDPFVLNGTKRYISNGCTAKLYFIVARTDLSKPLSKGHRWLPYRPIRRASGSASSTRR